MNVSIEGGPLGRVWASTQSGCRKLEDGRERRYAVRRDVTPAGWQHPGTVWPSSKPAYLEHTVRDRRRRSRIPIRHKEKHEEFRSTMRYANPMFSSRTQRHSSYVLAVGALGLEWEVGRRSLGRDERA